MAKTEEGGGVPSWRNWAGNQTATGVRVVHPGGPQEVADLVGAAPGGGTRVKAIGSGHSFTAIGTPTDLQLVLDRMDAVRHLDPETGRVTVGAGLSLHVLNQTLAAEGRALTNLGDIDVQTVAGAIATGTHGTGAHYGGIATQVTGIELVTGDGSLLWCSPSDHPEVWAAARIHLGALGVVTAVQLETVPLFALAAEEGVMSLEQLLAEWDGHFDGPDHFEAYWYPHTGMVSTKRNRRVGLDDLDPLPGWRAWTEDSFLQNTVFGAIIATGRRLPPVIPAANRIVVRALGSRHYTDLSHRVFATERRVRFCEMEYAIPRAAAVDTVRALTDAVERSGLRIAFPVELRVAAADDIPLSTASGRDSAYIAVHMPVGVDHRAYFALVAAVMDEVDGRPHWGKLHSLDSTRLRELYPRFDEFTSVRGKLDPAGIFANAELDRILGPQ
jgi:FAD-linked oxidoreductase